MAFKKFQSTKNKTVKSSYLHFLLLLLLLLLGTLSSVNGQENNTNTTSSSANLSSPVLSTNFSSPVFVTSSLSPSQTPSAMWNETDYNVERIFNKPLIPPWGSQPLDIISTSCPPIMGAFSTLKTHVTMAGAGYHPISTSQLHIAISEILDHFGQRPNLY